MYWAKEFSSRLVVTGRTNTFKIVLPLDRLINITSINQLKISNWLEIEGVIDVGQKNLNIQYNGAIGGYPSSPFGTEYRSYETFRSNCKDTEKKR